MTSKRLIPQAAGESRAVTLIVTRSDQKSRPSQSLLKKVIEINLMNGYIIIVITYKVTFDRNWSITLQ